MLCDFVPEEDMTFHLIMIIIINRNTVTQDRRFAVSSQIRCVGKHRWATAAWDTREKIETCRCIAAGKQLHRDLYHLMY